MTRMDSYISAALAEIPKEIEPGTPEARSYATIRESLLKAKARLATMARKDKEKAK